MIELEGRTPDDRISFELPARPLSMNDRMHWRPKAKITRAWRTAAHWAAVQHLGLAPSARRRPPCIVRLDLPVRAPGQRRDRHNLSPTIKACVDGLVDAGVWTDDTDDYVIVATPIVHKAEQPPVVHLDLYRRTR